MKKIYVAGKYNGKSRSEIADNIELAKRASLALINEGWNVFCPHTIYAHFDDYEILLGNVGYETWLVMDIEWLLMCDAIFLLENWEDSNGAKREKVIAEENDIQIFYDCNGYPLPSDLKDIADKKYTFRKDVKNIIIKLLNGMPNYEEYMVNSTMRELASCHIGDYIELLLKKQRG